MNAIALFGRAGERRLSLFPRLEPFPQFAVGLFGEACPHLAGILELIGGCVGAHENGAEIVPRRFRVRVTPDHKFIPLDTLRLQPIFATASAVRPVPAFGDNSLQSELRALLEKISPAPFQMLRN